MADSWAVVAAIAALLGSVGTIGGPFLGARRARQKGEVGATVFPSSTDFDKHLYKRWQEAKWVRVIHLSSVSLISRTPDSRYVDMLDAFVKRGGIYQRVVSSSVGEKDELLEADAKEFLRKHRGKRAEVYKLKEVVVDGLRVLKIMIIDDDEVCIGGGRDSTRPHNTLAIRNPAIVDFFASYFTHLLGASQRLSPDD